MMSSELKEASQDQHNEHKTRDRIQKSLIDLLKKDSKKIRDINKLTDLYDISNQIRMADLTVSLNVNRLKRKKREPRNQDYFDRLFRKIDQGKYNFKEEDLAERNILEARKAKDSALELLLIKAANELVYSSADPRFVQSVRDLVNDKARVEYIKKFLGPDSDSEFYGTVIQKLQATQIELNNRYVGKILKDTKSKHPAPADSQAYYSRALELLNHWKKKFLGYKTPLLVLEFFSRISENGRFYFGETRNDPTHTKEIRQEKMKMKYGIQGKFSVYETIEAVKRGTSMADVAPNESDTAIRDGKLKGFSSKTSLQKIPEEALIGNPEKRPRVQIGRFESKIAPPIFAINSRPMKGQPTHARTASSGFFSRTGASPPPHSPGIDPMHATEQFRKNLMQNADRARRKRKEWFGWAKEAETLKPITSHNGADKSLQQKGKTSPGKPPSHLLHESNSTIVLDQSLNQSKLPLQKNRSGEMIKRPHGKPPLNRSLLNEAKLPNQQPQSPSSRQSHSKKPFASQTRIHKSSTQFKDIDGQIDAYANLIADDEAVKQSIIFKLQDKYEYLLTTGSGPVTNAMQGSRYLRPYFSKKLHSIHQKTSQLQDASSAAEELTDEATLELVGLGKKKKKKLNLSNSLLDPNRSKLVESGHLFRRLGETNQQKPTTHGRIDGFPPYDSAQTKPPNEPNLEDLLTSFNLKAEEVDRYLKATGASEKRLVAAASRLEQDWPILSKANETLGPGSLSELP